VEPCAGDVCVGGWTGTEVGGGEAVNGAPNLGNPDCVLFLGR
jgi:hypothetical protein